jgi:3-oxoacyl-[acyl-carrier protein] reductase
VASEVRRAVEYTVETFGRLDILVNNAGITRKEMCGPLLDLTEEGWDSVLNSHLRSTFLCIKYAAPHMVRRGWGRIINTSSIHGRVGGRAGFGHYGAAKAGVIGLTHTAARELGPSGITANVIAPGIIGTEIVRSNLGDDRIAALSAQIPIRRLGKPQEVATIVTFLASEAASYLNGAIIDIHGGRLEFVFS